MAESTIIAIVIAFLIFAVAVWAIGVLPMPAGGFPLKSILYVIAAVLLIVYLLRFI